MPPEIATFPYIQLGFAVSVVLITLWMMIRGEKSKQTQTQLEQLRNLDNFQFPNTQVHLGGVFTQITNKLDRIATELSTANDDARADRNLNRQRFEDVKRSINEVALEIKEMNDILAFENKRRQEAWKG